MSTGEDKGIFQPLYDLSQEELETLEDAMTQYVLSGGDPNSVTVALNQVAARIHDLQGEQDD